MTDKEKIIFGTVMFLLFVFYVVVVIVGNAE